MRKNIRSYSLSPSNEAWLDALAAFESLTHGRRVSASELLDRFIDEMRTNHTFNEERQQEFIGLLQSKLKVAA